MNREELKEEWCDDLLKDSIQIERLIDSIYDDFESRTCENCRFRMSNIDGTLLCMNGKAPDFLLERTVPENFSCSLFDKGEEGEQK